MTKSKRRVSIVFRALNEEKWFEPSLRACHDQVADGLDIEIVLVDSGSTDRTIEIAKAYGARIVHIRKADFTFGRSLNYGCEAATGEYLVLISAHCIPDSPTWLKNLIAPLDECMADYVYGRQIGHDVSRFSEHAIFAQYFPSYDKLPQEDFFINNANSALRKETWARYRFDETVTGLEDMVLAKAIQADGGKIGYLADAPVVHVHEEGFGQTYWRYYREALTLRQIVPNIHFHLGDFLRYFTAAILTDATEALRTWQLHRRFREIVAFRFMQYWGTYRGHNEHRQLSREQKEKYYYPRKDKGRTRTVDDATSGDPARVGE